MASKKKPSPRRLQIAELQGILRTLEVEREALYQRIGAIQQQITLLSTPLRPGDHVTFDGSKKAWELTRITPGYSDGTQPKFYGRVLKSDGTPGAVEHEIWQVPYGKELKAIKKGRKGVGNG